MKDAGELHDELQAEVAALVSGDEWARMLEVAARFHQYSFGNVLLIRAQRPDASRVAGYKRWQSLGRQVLKGERGIRILAPSTYRKKVETDDGEEAEYRVLKGFHVVSVFDIAQTEGDEIPTVSPELLDGEAPAGLIEQLAERIRAEGFTVAFEIPDMAGANGQTDFLASAVKVHPDLSPAQQAKTLAHELAHVLMHAGDRMLGGCREEKEVEAESVAFIVSRSAGLATGGYSFAYVARWAGGDPKVVSGCGQKVIETARDILGSLGMVEVAA